MLLDFLFCIISINSINSTYATIANVKETLSGYHWPFDFV